MKQLPPRKSFLAQLLREIVDQIPDDTAIRLSEGYVHGKTIMLWIGQNSHDPIGNKTAFACTLTTSQEWRELPTHTIVTLRSEFTAARPKAKGKE